MKTYYHISPAHNIESITSSGLQVEKTGGGVYLLKLNQLRLVLNRLKSVYGKSTKFALYKVTVPDNTIISPAEDGYRVEYGSIPGSNVKFLKYIK